MASGQSNAWKRTGLIDGNWETGLLFFFNALTDWISPEILLLSRPYSFFSNLTIFCTFLPQTQLDFVSCRHLATHW